MPLIVKIYGVENYGILSQINTFKNLYVSIAGLRQQAAFIKHESGKSKREQISTFEGIFLFVFTINIIFFLICCSFKENLSFMIFGRIKLEKYVYIALMLGVVSVLYDLLITFYRTSKKIWIAAMFLLLSSLSYLLVVIYSYLLKIDFNIFLKSYFFLQFSLLMLIVIYFSINNHLQKLSIKFDIIKMGLFLTPIAVSRWVMNSVDRFFITHFLGLRFTGEFAIAKTIASLTGFIPYSLLYLYYPVISSNWNNRKLNELSKNYRKFFLSILIFTILVGIFLSFLAPPLIKFILGRKFNNYLSNVNQVVIMIMVLTVAFSGIFQLDLYFFYLLEDYKNLYFLFFISTLLNLLLNFFLVPLLGIIGAIHSSNMSYIVALVFSSFFVHRKALIKKEDFNFPLKIFILVFYLIFTLISLI